MEKDLISLALQEIVLQNGKDLKEVQQYLRMRFQLDADEMVLKRRLEKMMQSGKAVA